MVSNTRRTHESPYMNMDDLVYVAGLCLHGQDRMDDLIKTVGNKVFEDSLYRDSGIFYPPTALYHLAQETVPDMLQQDRLDNDLYLTSGSLSLSKEDESILIEAYGAEFILTQERETDFHLHKDDSDETILQRSRLGDTFFKSLETYLREKKYPKPAKVKSHGFLDNLATMLGGFFKKKDRSLRHDM